MKQSKTFLKYDYALIILGSVCSAFAVFSLSFGISFVSDFKDGNENAQILQTIVALAKNLDLRAVAEGIETEEHLRLLQNLGYDIGQGYLFSKPLPKAEIEEILRQNKDWFPPNFVNSIEESGLI